MSLVQYVPTNTIVHRLDPRVKLALVPFVLVVSLILAHPLYLLIGVVAIIGAWVYIRAPLAYASRMLVVILIFLVMIVGIQGMFYHQRTSSYDVKDEARIVFLDLIPANLRSGPLGNVFGAADDPDRGLVLYEVGVIFGLMLTLRFGCIVAIMPLVTMTTPLTDLMLALTKIRVPWKISYLVVTSFRFVPLLMSQTDTILNAQKLRGLSVEKANLIKRITAYAPLAVPVILGAFRNSELLEMVLAVRGFTNVTERTTLYEIRWRPIDTAAVVAMGIVVIVSIGLRVTGIAGLPASL